MLFRTLTDAMADIGLMSGRLKIQDRLKTLFMEAASDKEDLLAVLYLCMGKMDDDYKNTGELGIGDAMFLKMLVEKKSPEKDIEKGMISCFFSSSSSSSSLTVLDILLSFRHMTTIHGSGAQSLKKKEIETLLGRCRHENEARFLLRGIRGKLSIGLAEATILSSLALAIYSRSPSHSHCCSEKEAVQWIRTAYYQCPDMEILTNTLSSLPLNRIMERCVMRPGIPILPMLARIGKLEDCDGHGITAEYKYDGERAQIHFDGNKICIFSRNLENTTRRFPDVSIAMMSSLSSTLSSFIVDAEIVAIDASSSSILPFQVLSERKRDVENVADITIPVVVILFDMMYHNGKSLLDRPLKERRELLSSSFQKKQGVLEFAQFQNESGMELFMEEAIRDQCEGLMLKHLEGIYLPGERPTNGWIKLKKDYIDGIAESLDLIVMGYYHGKGKRNGWPGAFLVGCLNTTEDTVETVCRVGTGFSDSFLRSFLSTTTKQVATEHMPSEYRVSTSQVPDVWLLPRVVWEVRTADLTFSPAHTAGSSQLHRGIGLRFPRFMRERPDKRVSDATTTLQVIEMHTNQGRKK